VTDQPSPGGAPLFPVFRWLASAAQPAIALVISALVGGILVAAIGDDPIQIYGILISGSLVGVPNLMVTLQIMTPLLFTGLAVSIAFRAGLWNIGVEGQMLVGGFFAGLVGWLLPLPAVLHIPLTLIAAMFGGALWSAIPAFLRIKLNVNELVVCLMLNPVALLLTGYFTIHVLKAAGPTNKLPDVLETAMLPQFSLFSQANAGVFLALGCCILFAVINGWTVRGFEWKIMGLDPTFAYYGGVDVPRRAISAMLVSGAIAGLGGAEEVMGVYRAFFDGFSPGYGFDGIAVAMLANFNPLAVIAAAALFGALESGGAVLQMTTNISKYLVEVLQFTTVLILAAQFSWGWLRRWGGDGVEAERVGVIAEPSPNPVAAEET
jgi:general nucleoside transport system permease protein